MKNLQFTGHGTDPRRHPHLLSTNIDDLVILNLFFGNKWYGLREVIGGQYLGILAQTGLSLVLSLMGLWMDTAYTGLLGFFPIYLGL